MKTSISVGAIAIAALIAAAQPGYSQQFVPPGYGGSAYSPGFAAATPPAYGPPGPASYGPQPPYGYGYGPVAPVGFAQGPSAQAPYAAPPPENLAPIVGNGFGQAPVEGQLEGGYGGPSGPPEYYGAPHAAPMGPPPAEYGGGNYDGQYYDGRYDDGYLSDPGHYGDHAPLMEGDCQECGGVGCCVCEPLCRPRFWGGVEFLAWWRSDRFIPPILTTSPPGTPFPEAGLLPNAEVLIGGGLGGERPKPGARVYAGMWLDELHEVAIVSTAWAIENERISSLFQSSGEPDSQILAQPFFSTLTDSETRAIIAFPGFSSGSIRLTSNNSSVAGGDALIRTNWDRGPWYSVDLLGGYMFSRMDDSLVISAHRESIAPNGPPPIGATLDLVDMFHTKNTFNGGAVGMMTQFISDNQRWTMEFIGKLGFGNMHQRVSIRGRTVATVPGGGEAISQGGLFTQPTNIGDYLEDRFTVAPVVEARMNYFVTPRIGVSIGYSFLYWAHVALAGQQIDRVINPTQFGGGVLVGRERPEFVFTSSDFWLQGITAGVTAQF